MGEGEAGKTQGQSGTVTVHRERRRAGLQNTESEVTGQGTDSRAPAGRCASGHTGRGPLGTRAGSAARGRRPRKASQPAGSSSCRHLSGPPPGGRWEFGPKAPRGQRRAHAWGGDECPTDTAEAPASLAGDCPQGTRWCSGRRRPGREGGSLTYFLSSPRTFFHRFWRKREGQAREALVTVPPARALTGH